MAITASVLGRVDLPPGLVGGSSTAPDASEIIVELTLGATTDYSTATGVTHATIVAAINALTTAAGSGVSAIIGAQVISVRIAAGTVLFGFGVHDVTNAKVRFFTAITNQTTATDFTPAAADVWRMKLVCI